MAMDDQFSSKGSQVLLYDEYIKVIALDNGCIKVANRGIAMRHRLSM